MVLSSTQKDIDEFFERERVFLTEYYSHIRDSTAKADRMTRSHKGEIFLSDYLFLNFFQSYKCSCGRQLHQDLFDPCPTGPD